jgi:hypothetical protein
LVGDVEKVVVGRSVVLDMGGGRGVVGDESGGWMVMEKKLLLGEVLCERWVGVGDDESGG